jgi:photosystem II stability/assembly factor-like uncharacterized protein
VTSLFLGTAQGNNSLEAIGSRLKTTHPSAGTAHLLELAHGDGSLVTVGEQGTLAISEDAGTTWQIVDLGFDISDNLLDVAYGAGRYLVAAGSKGMLTALREDLTRWELTGVPDISSPASIEFLNGQFFAMGRGRIATSVDGLSWQELPSIPEGSFTDITYGAGLYVLVGSSGAIYSSSDLQTWFLEDSDLVDWEKNSHLYG